MKKIKKGNHLVNVRDIFGQLHEKATVIGIYLNTISIIDDISKNTWIVHKKDIGIEPDLPAVWMRQKEHFNMKSTQQKGIPKQAKAAKRWIY